MQPSAPNGQNNNQNISGFTITGPAVPLNSQTQNLSNNPISQAPISPDIVSASLNPSLTPSSGMGQAQMAPQVNNNFTQTQAPQSFNNFDTNQAAAPTPFATGAAPFTVPEPVMQQPASNSFPPTPTFNNQIPSPAPETFAAMDSNMLPPTPDQISKDALTSTNYNYSQPQAQVNPQDTATVNPALDQFMNNMAQVKGVDLPPGPIPPIPDLPLKFGPNGEDVQASSDFNPTASQADQSALSTSPSQTISTNNSALTDEDKKLVQFAKDMALLYGSVDNQTLKDDILKRWNTKLDEIAAKYK